MSHNCPNNNLNLSPVRENGEALRGEEQEENMDFVHNIYGCKRICMKTYRIENNITKDLIFMLNKINKKFLDINKIEYEVKGKIILQGVVYSDDKIHTMAKRIYQRIKDICTPDLKSHEYTMKFYKLENDLTIDVVTLVQYAGINHNGIIGYLEKIKHIIARETSSTNLLDEKKIDNMALRIIQCVSDSSLYDSSSHANLVVLNEKTKKKVHTSNCLDNEFDQIFNQICERENRLIKNQLYALTTGNGNLLSIDELRHKIKNIKIDSAEFDDVKINSMANRIYERVEYLSKFESVEERIMRYFFENNYTQHLLMNVKNTDIIVILRTYDIEFIKNELMNESLVKGLIFSYEEIESMAKRIFQRMNDALLCDPSYRKFVGGGSDKRLDENNTLLDK